MNDYYEQLRNFTTEEFLELFETPEERDSRLIAESKELEKIFDVPFTFSQWCRSGLLPEGTCQCWRCRQGRGEPVSEETNRIAKEQAQAADAAVDRK